MNAAITLSSLYPFAVEIKGLLIYFLHIAAPDHQRLHLHPRGGGPGQVPRHHVPPQGRLLQVQGQDGRRPHLGSQHHHGCAKPGGLSREQHFKFQNSFRVGYTQEILISCLTYTKYKQGHCRKQHPYFLNHGL